jgi:hypothetical protein
MRAKTKLGAPLIHSKNEQGGFVKTIEALRTPDSRFQGLPGYRYEPHYVDSLPDISKGLWKKPLTV